MIPTPYQGQVRSKPPQACRETAEPPRVKRSLSPHPPPLPRAPPPYTALTTLGFSQPLLLSPAHQRSQLFSGARCPGGKSQLQHH